MRHRESAGLLLYRWRDAELQVLLGHPGGPYWSRRDDGAWSIPKGGLNPGEDLLTAAQREFLEETGFAAAGPFLPLGQVTQRSGKVVHAWAFEGDCDPACLHSIATTTEWPPRSGRVISIPELDRVRFFPLPDARVAINVAQVEFIDRLTEVLSLDRPSINH